MSKSKLSPEWRGISGVPMDQLTREQLLFKCRKLIEALQRKHAQLQEAAADLPLNKRANDRHQKHKAAWGATKKRMLQLLHETLPHVPAELAEAIRYEIAHAEFLYQKKVSYIKRRKSRAPTPAPPGEL